MSAASPVRLATFEGIPVRRKGRKPRPPERRTLFEKHRMAVLDAERVAAQARRVMKIIDALGDLARRDDRLVVVHAVWRDLSIEAGACAHMAEGLTDRLSR